MKCTPEVTALIGFDSVKMAGWMDDLIVILCLFQEYFSHIRTTGG